MSRCYQCNSYYSVVYPSASCVSKNCALSDLLNAEATILCILLTVSSKMLGNNTYNLIISNTIRAHMMSLCAACCANLWSHAVFCLKDMVKDNMFDKNSGIECELKWSIQNDMLCYSGIFCN